MKNLINYIIIFIAGGIFFVGLVAIILSRNNVRPLTDFHGVYTYYDNAGLGPPPPNYTGLWKLYIKGKPVFIQRYQNGELNGQSYVFSDDEVLTSVENYKNGIKDGQWVSFPSNISGICEVKEYRDGEPYNGKFTFSEKDCEITQTYRDGKVIDSTSTPVIRIYPNAKNTTSPLVVITRNTDDKIQGVSFIDVKSLNTIRRIEYHPNNVVEFEDVLLRDPANPDREIVKNRIWNEQGIMTADLSKQSATKNETSVIPFYHGRCTFWDDEGKPLEDVEYVDNEIVRDYIKEGKTRQPLPPPTYDISLDMPVPKWIERDEN